MFLLSVLILVSERDGETQLRNGQITTIGLFNLRLCTQRRNTIPKRTENDDSTRLSFCRIFGVEHACSALATLRPGSSPQGPRGTPPPHIPNQPMRFSASSPAPEPVAQPFRRFKFDLRQTLPIPTRKVSTVPSYSQPSRWHPLQGTPI